MKQNQRRINWICEVDCCLVWLNLKDIITVIRLILSITKTIAEIILIIEGIGERNGWN